MDKKENRHSWKGRAQIKHSVSSGLTLCAIEPQSERPKEGLIESSCFSIGWVPVTSKERVLRRAVALLFLHRLVLVVMLPTMLGFQFLSLDLIFPNRILVARPVKVDDIPGAVEDRVVGSQTLFRHRWKLLVTVTACGELIFLENTVLSHRVVKRSQCTCEKQGCQK